MSQEIDKHSKIRVQVFDQKPLDFNPQAYVIAAYVEVEGKLLLLQLSHIKKEPNRWGVPAGRLEADELPEDGVLRELFEETNISVEATTQVHSLGQLYIRKPEVDYVYHAFKIKLNQVPQVSLSDEHIAYKWVSPNEAKELDLMEGAREALKFYLNSLKKMRSGASVNVYLILRKNDEVLLHLRKNTGYCDGFYGLVSGHVEDGEPATQAMIREAYEEAGIHIQPSALKAVHILHRKTNRLNIDIFFECNSWTGAITNQEPDKCLSLEFFSMKDLPSNMIDYISCALKHAFGRNLYSEIGWGVS